MAVSYIQRYLSTPASATTHTAAGVVVASGDYVIACGLSRDGTPETVTGVTFGGSGSGWAQLTGGTFHQEGIKIDAWAAAGLSGTQDVVMTFGTAPQFTHLAVFVVRGQETGTPVGTIVTASAIDDNLDLPGATTTNGDGLILSVIYVRANDSALAVVDGTERHETAEGGFGSTTGSLTKPGGTGVTSGWTYTGPFVQAAAMGIPINADAGGGGGGHPHGKLIMLGVG